MIFHKNTILTLKSKLELLKNINDKKLSTNVEVWPGLNEWRFKGQDLRLTFGEKGPEKSNYEYKNVNLPNTLAECGKLVLITKDPQEKMDLTHRIFQELIKGKINETGTVESIEKPGRPERPILIKPKDMPKIEESPLPKSVYMLHNLAHIELNAIDLAWDTIVRFSYLKLENQFYKDFARVASDESRHFGWCQQRLKELGYKYGDMEAHSILWNTSQISNHDISARLALVPMCQEARGLDAGPRLSNKLKSINDIRSSKIVDQIALEEKAHVAVGLYWFLKISELLGCDPGPLFRGYVQTLCPELLSGRFDHKSRKEVGLVRNWYDKTTWLENNVKVYNEAKLKLLRERLMVILDIEMSNT